MQSVKAPMISRIYFYDLLNRELGVIVALNFKKNGNNNE